MALLLCAGCSGSDGTGSGSVDGVSAGAGGGIPSGIGGMAGTGVAGAPGSGGDGSGAGGATLCEDVCAWPSSCLEEFAPALGDADCVDACEGSVVFLGTACLEAIDATVVCLGTCDESELTAEDIERCDETALQIEVACE